MSAGSPDSAAHRNGPLPSQNSGRMYAGTNPGKSNARVVAGQLRLAPDRVAVVEHLGAGVLEPDHRLDVAGHRLARPVGEAGRVLRRARPPSPRTSTPTRQVGERVVGRRLVGDDVDRAPRREQVGHDVGGVAEHADRQRPPRVAGLVGQPQRLVDRRSPRRRGSGARSGARSATDRTRRRSRRRRSSSPRAAARRPCRRARRSA